MGRRNMLRCLASNLLNRHHHDAQALPPATKHEDDEAYHVVGDSNHNANSPFTLLPFSKSNSNSSIDSNEDSQKQQQEEEEQETIQSPPPQEQETPQDSQEEETETVNNHPPKPLSVASATRRCQSLSDLPSSAASSLNASAAQEGTTQDTTPSPAARRVSFSNLEIRSYKVILGDPHPYCSAGCSLSLDWEVTSQTTFALDQFEAQRPTRRSCSQLKLSAEERREWLMLHDDSINESDLRRACRQRHRARSCVARLERKNQRDFFFGAAQEDDRANTSQQEQES